MTKAEETRKNKAFQLRYKKPIVRDLNLETIKTELWDIKSECSDVRYYFETDDDTLINALDGDEDEAYEFRMMFAELDAECDQMVNDLDDWLYQYVDKYFDKFFVAVGAGRNFGGILGFDEYEGDYYGLGDISEEWASEQSAKSLEQLTKKELIEAARRCFRIYQSYIGLRYRYDCLKASMDILRDQNTGYLQMVKQIEEVYEKANEKTCGFRYQFFDEVKELDKILENMPQEAWIQ